MTSANSAQTDDRFLSNAMASFIQMGALLILIMWCYSIIAPFVIILAWGMIISVALYPGHTSLTAKLGGREKLSAFILVAIGLAIVIVPTWLTAGSSSHPKTAPSWQAWKPTACYRRSCSPNAIS